MKEQIYKLNPLTKYLEQQPEIKEPEIPLVVGFPITDEHEQEWKIYEKHIASLKKYPISGIVPPEWETDRDIDPKEFKVHWNYTHDYSRLKVGMTLHKITGSEVIIDEIKKDDCGRDCFYTAGICMATQYDSGHNMLTKQPIYAYDKVAVPLPILKEVEPVSNILSGHENLPQGTASDRVEQGKEEVLPGEYRINEAREKIYLEEVEHCNANSQYREEKENDELNNEDELWNEVMGICVKANYYLSMNHMQDFRNEMEKLKSFTIKRKVKL